MKAQTCHIYGAFDLLEKATFSAGLEESREPRSFVLSGKIWNSKTDLDGAAIELRVCEGDWRIERDHHSLDLADAAQTNGIGVLFVTKGARTVFHPAEDDYSSRVPGWHQKPFIAKVYLPAWRYDQLNGLCLQAVSQATSVAIRLTAFSERFPNEFGACFLGNVDFSGGITAELIGLDASVTFAANKLTNAVVWSPEHRGSPLTKLNIDILHSCSALRFPFEGYQEIQLVGRPSTKGFPENLKHINLSIEEYPRTDWQGDSSRFGAYPQVASPGKFYIEDDYISLTLYARYEDMPNIRSELRTISGNRAVLRVSLLADEALVRSGKCSQEGEVKYWSISTQSDAEWGESVTRQSDASACLVPKTARPAHKG